MENTSQKLFSPWLILIIVIALGFTFYKTIILNDFEVINTESEEMVAEEDVDGEVVLDEEPLLDSVLDETSAPIIIEATSTEIIEAM